MPLTPEDVLPRLISVRKAGHGWVACCPAHDDKHPSLSVGTGRNGRVLLHCYSGCSFHEILSALGLDYKPQDDRLPAKPPSPPRWKRWADILTANEQDPRIRSAIKNHFRWGYEYLPNRDAFEVWRQEAYEGLCVIHRACLRVMAAGEKADEDALAASCRLQPRIEFLLNLVQHGTREEIEEFSEWW
ncbi:MAG: CHC2 zinc finger domain-containing protein [Bacillota bacterium]